MKTIKLTLLSVALSITAFAQTVVTKEGTGEAAVINKDEIKAFDEAKDKALRAAVEQAAGVRIDADTVVVNNQLVRDQVFANTSGYVKKFDVLDKKVERGVMTVKVKADIISENLDKDLEAARSLVKRMGKPTLVIVIQEQTFPIGGKAIYSSESISIVLTESLKADGWDIKNDQGMNKKLKVDGAVTLTETSAKEIADTSGANFVLYGKALMRHQECGAGYIIPCTDAKGVQSLFMLSGEYDLTVYATDTADQITKLNGKIAMDPKLKINATDSYERTAFDLIKARKDEIVAPVRKAILEHFRDQTVNGKKLNVSVGGLENFGAAKDFKKSIEAMKGIKEATQDGFANGKAAYRITFLGSSSDFAEVIEGSTFKKKKLNVVSVSGNTLEVQVAK